MARRRSHRDLIRAMILVTVAAVLVPLTWYAVNDPTAWVSARTMSFICVAYTAWAAWVALRTGRR